VPHSETPLSLNPVLSSLEVQLSLLLVKENVESIDLTMIVDIYARKGYTPSREFKRVLESVLLKQFTIPYVKESQ